jgi:hypothetical protein
MLAETRDTRQPQEMIRKRRIAISMTFTNQTQNNKDYRLGTAYFQGFPIKDRQK